MAEDINQEGPDQMEGRVKIWLVGGKGKSRSEGQG